MEIFNSFFDTHIKTPTAITIGKFDCLHKGHQQLTSEIISKKASGLNSCLITFKNSPKYFLFKDMTPLLFINEEKKYILEKFGIDYLILCEFNKKFMELDSIKFIEILCKNLKMKYLAVGEDFTFGYKGSGNVDLLKKISKTYGFELKVFKKIKQDDKDITSTYIRGELLKGNIKLVNEMLGYEYFIFGEVICKKNVQNKMEIQPIYIIPVKNKLMPKFGTYCTKIFFEGKEFSGVSKIGKNLMIDGDCKTSEDTIQIETYINECNNLDLDGKRIKLSFNQIHEEA